MGARRAAKRAPSGRGGELAAARGNLRDNYFLFDVFSARENRISRELEKKSFKL
jgi:hypothetical protein